MIATPYYYYYIICVRRASECGLVARATSIAIPRKGRPPCFVEALDLNDDRKEASWKKDQVVEVLGTEIQGTSIGAVTVGVCRGKKRLDGRQEGDEQYIFIDEKSHDSIDSTKEEKHDGDSEHHRKKKSHKKHHHKKKKHSMKMMGAFSMGKKKLGHNSPLAKKGNERKRPPEEAQRNVFAG